MQVKLNRYGKDGSTYRVIFGQGVGGSVLHPEIVDVVKAWCLKPSLSHVEFYLPTAPTRAVSMKGGEMLPAWFNLEHGPADGPSWLVNLEQLAWASKVYIDLAKVNGGDFSKTVFAGFSNGGAVALYTGIQTCCAGVLSMSSVIVGKEKLIAEGLIIEQKKPVLLCCGSHDPLVPPADSHDTQTFLSSTTKCDVELKMFDRDHHGCTMSEADTCANWLASVLLPDF